MEGRIVERGVELARVNASTAGPSDRGALREVDDLEERQCKDGLRVGGRLFLGLGPNGSAHRIERVWRVRAGQAIGGGPQVWARAPISALPAGRSAGVAPRFADARNAT